MDVGKLIQQEEQRQQVTLQLIPSENYASRAVREAVGSVLMNKYSEGYPGKRYYQGNKVIDEVETHAIDLAKKLFGVPHVNVQPYSGSPANAAILMGLLDPGDKIMGLKLSGGGHLTHGHPAVTFSGKYFNSIQFDVDENGLIDYDHVAKLAHQERPKLMIVGTTAYPRILDFARFAQIADSIGALLVADISHIAGLVIGGAQPSPVDHVHVVMTTTHKTLRGPRGAMILVTEKGLGKNPDMAKKIDRAVFPGLQGGPHDNVTAGIVVALQEAAKPEFKNYAKQVVTNAHTLASELVGLGFDLATGGTDNHLMVIDLQSKGVSGKQAAVELENAGIVVNRNTVPHDPNPPANPSGLRLGTPAVTTRGMQEPEMVQIAKWIHAVLVEKRQNIDQEVKALCAKFPCP